MLLKSYSKPNFPTIAERKGFEPLVPFWSTHTFQACSFDHSDISPFLSFQIRREITNNFCTEKIF